MTVESVLNKGRVLATAKSSSKDILPGASTMSFISRTRQGNNSVRSSGNDQQQSAILITDAKSGSYNLKNPSKGPVNDYASTFEISGGGGGANAATLASKSEYLRNKTQKRTNIISLKPEVAGMTDKRIAENNFNSDIENHRSV